MIDVDKANSNKEKIIQTISTRGPSLPVHLAQAMQLSPLFTSAFLSELYNEGKVKISNMKVGSSPLYYLSGQENMLENFIDYLNAREKEALYHLKKEQILDDELQTPVIRVALRAIKDFALPIRITIGGKEKTFWKYYLIPESNIKPILDNIINPKHKEEAKEEKHEKQLPLEPTITPEKVTEEPVINTTISEALITESPKPIDSEENISVKKTKKKSKDKETKESKFCENVKTYLASKNLEIMEMIEEKKKEFIAKVRTDTMFGKQEYYIIAKDKKKISETDLSTAFQKSNENKMPSIILSAGEPDKKAKEHHKSIKNIVKLDKL
jgi:hypothetical protein